MIEVRTLEQLSRAIRNLRADYARGYGTMELIRSLGIDPLSQLRGGDWRGTNFAGCDLRGVDFSHARLSFCDFTNADVAGAIFYGADLYKCTLHRALNVSAAYMFDAQWSYLEECQRYDARSEGSGEWVYQTNQSIRASTTFQSAAAQFQSILTRGLQPDQYSAGLLISRAGSPQEAWHAFAMIETARCPLNAVVFVELAAKMTEVDQVQEVISLMRSKGFMPGVYIYNTLLSRSRATESSAVLEQMRTAGIKADNVTFEILMRRTDFAGQKRLLAQLVDTGLHPNTTELNILMSRAKNEDEADEVIEIANELEIGRNADTYALLAPHKLRASAFESLMDDMTEDDLHRDIDFYKLAFGKATSFSGACFLYGCMQSDETSPTTYVYNRLANLAGVPFADRDPGRVSWPAKAIESLIRRVGSPAEIVAAGLTTNNNG